MERLMPTIAELRAKEQAAKNVPLSEMTLRDWFAGQALTGYISSDEYVHEALAKLAYKSADDMMKERVK
jgi:hypothetical protein